MRTFFIAFLSITPRAIITDGFEDKIFLANGDFRMRVEDSISNVAKVTIGINACINDFSSFVMGSEAISDSNMAMTNSLTSNSPS